MFMGPVIMKTTEKKELIRLKCFVGWVALVDQMDSTDWNCQLEVSYEVIKQKCVQLSTELTVNHNNMSQINMLKENCRLILAS